MRGTVALLLTMLAASAFAQDWNSEIELGAVITTGNTQQENLKLRLGTERTGTTIEHSARLDALRSSEDSVVTAQKYYLYYQADYRLDDRHSLFGRVSYEDDRFSGFDYQLDETVGYSRVLMDSGVMKLVGDLGLGMRQSQRTGSDSMSEFITRLAARFDWQISESAEFRQTLSTEIGEDSTISRSETSLQSTIISALAMKLALTIKHQSEVPMGNENTDTETSVTLVYHF